ncbi:hypothetical protein V8E36_005804 [Tilletia maclaganii]
MISTRREAFARRPRPSARRVDTNHLKARVWCQRLSVSASSTVLERSGRGRHPVPSQCQVVDAPLGPKGIASSTTDSQMTRNVQVTVSGAARVGKHALKSLSAEDSEDGSVHYRSGSDGEEDDDGSSEEEEDDDGDDDDDSIGGRHRLQPTAHKTSAFKTTNASRQRDLSVGRKLPAFVKRIDANAAKHDTSSLSAIPHQESGMQDILRKILGKIDGLGSRFDNLESCVEDLRAENIDIRAEMKTISNVSSSRASSASVRSRLSSVGPSSSPRFSSADRGTRGSPILLEDDGTEPSRSALKPVPGFISADTAKEYNDKIEELDQGEERKVNEETILWTEASAKKVYEALRLEDSALPVSLPLEFVLRNADGSLIVDEEDEFGADIGKARIESYRSRVRDHMTKIEKAEISAAGSQRRRKGQYHVEFYDIRLKMAAQFPELRLCASPSFYKIQMLIDSRFKTIREMVANEVKRLAGSLPVKQEKSEDGEVAGNNVVSDNRRAQAANKDEQPAAPKRQKKEKGKAKGIDALKSRIRGKGTSASAKPGATKAASSPGEDAAAAPLPVQVKAGAHQQGPPQARSQAYSSTHRSPSAEGEHPQSQFEAYGNPYQARPEPSLPMSQYPPGRDGRWWYNEHEYRAAFSDHPPSARPDGPSQQMPMESPGLASSRPPFSTASGAHNSSPGLPSIRNLGLPPALTPSGFESKLPPRNFSVLHHSHMTSQSQPYH